MKGRFDQYKQIQDQTVKLLNERILTLEQNLLAFMKDTFVCDDDKVAENVMSSKKRKVTILNHIDEYTDNVLEKVPKLKNDTTNLQSDVEMTECMEENKIAEYFCENTLGNLRMIESKIKTSKIEDTKNSLKNMKEKYKNFTKTYGNGGNDNVNIFFEKDDIQAFIQKLEAIHKKWISYSRNNFKVKSNMDILELFKELEKIKVTRNSKQLWIKNDKIKMTIEMDMNICTMEIYLETGMTK